MGWLHELLNHFSQDLLPDFRGIAENSLLLFNNFLCDFGVIAVVSLRDLVITPLPSGNSLFPNAVPLGTCTTWSCREGCNSSSLLISSFPLLLFPCGVSSVNE